MGSSKNKLNQAKKEAASDFKLSTLISKKDYLKALKTIEKYRKQNNLAVTEKTIKKNILKLEEGDYVICKNVDIENLKRLTKGKFYEILELIFSDGDVIVIIIKDDTGIENQFKLTEKLFKIA